MIAVMGATGTVGRHVVADLLAAGAPVRTLSRTGRPVDPAATAVPFSATDPTTWPAAFTDAEALFAMRPPQIARVRRDLLPALAAARDAGVDHVVFLSVLGAQRNPLLPHRQVERWLDRSGFTAVHLRAGNFMQNLLTVHGDDIRAGRLVVPAGDAAMSYVDAADVAAVAASCLRRGPGPDGAIRALDVTGPEAITHHQVAEVLSDVLGFPVHYTRPTLRQYRAHAAAIGMDRRTITVTSALYTLARLGIGARIGDGVPRVLGRPATDLATYVARTRPRWID